MLFRVAPDPKLKLGENEKLNLQEALKHIGQSQQHLELELANAIVPPLLCALRFI
jgi:hypothetical protein